MAKIGAFIESMKKFVELDADDLQTLLSRTVIRGVHADDESNYVSLDLNEGIYLSISAEEGTLSINAKVWDKTSYFPLQLFPDFKETPTVYMFERRLYALRQLYCLVLLIQSGRTQILPKDFEKIDIEQKFLKDDEKLLITAAGEGSFWVTAFTKAVEGVKSLSFLAATFYSEGRQALLERVRAGTDLKKLDVEQKRTNIAFDKANKFVELTKDVEKIKDPEMKESLLRALRQNVEVLGHELPSLSKAGGSHKP